MKRWRELSTPAWGAILTAVGVLVGGGLVAVAALIGRGVVDEQGCRFGPSDGRLMLKPRDEAYVSLALPRARELPARVASIRSNGTLPDDRLSFSVLRDEDLGRLRRGSARRAPAAAQPVKAAVLRSYEADRLVDPRTDPERSGWSLVIGIAAQDRGIFHLSSLDITYRAGETTSICKHHLSLMVGVGERAQDATRVPPVYVGVGYGHSLYTHCGIWQTSFGGLVWYVDPPLHRDKSRPPALWSDPYEAGTMRLVEPTVALFQTKDKLEARFRPRAPDDPPIRACD